MFRLPIAEGASVDRFLTDSSAATATEYAVMLAAMLLAFIAAITTLGSKVDGLFALAKEGW